MVLIHCYNIDYFSRPEDSQAKLLDISNNKINCIMEELPGVTHCNIVTNIAEFELYLINVALYHSNLQSIYRKCTRYHRIINNTETNYIDGMAPL